MSKIRLYGSTSGYVDLAAPAVADDGVLTLPTAAAGFGKVVQVVYSSDSTSRSTNSQSFVSAQIERSITPIFDDSLLVVEWHFSGGIGITSGTTTERRAGYRIYNTTTAAAMSHAVENMQGRTLVSSSSVSAASYYVSHIVGLEVSGSTNARTYQGQFKCYAASSLNFIQNDGNSGFMKITEIKA